MEYNRLKHSWEEEEKAGNLSAALELQEKQIRLNIDRFLDHFREEPLEDIAKLWMKGLNNGIIFNKEIDEIPSPFFRLEKKLNDISYEEQFIYDCDDYVSPDESTREQRHFIRRYARLEIKTAVLMARFDEAVASLKLEQAIPGIVESIESTKYSERPV